MAKKIRIFFNYKHIDDPWGGANNFIRALYTQLKANGEFEFANNLNDDYEILFLNQLSTGPANNSKKITCQNVELWKKGFIANGQRKKIVVRAVNLKRHAFRLGVRSYIHAILEDRNSIRLLNLADLVIFQSAYQETFFEEYGYKGKTHSLIHNGADLSFYRQDIQPRVIDGSLRLISSTASDRPTKRHDLIARFSDIPGVEVIHVGVWPSGLDKRNVILMGVKSASEMSEMYARMHFFLHPAVKDPCPNAIFEAICSGLPVIYNPDIGSGSEIVGENGLPLDESKLQKTVQEAHKKYDSIFKNIQKTREYYSIKRACDKYTKVFKDIVEQN